MISYSKVFKASSLSLQEEVKVITQPIIQVHGEDKRTEELEESGEGQGIHQDHTLVQEAKVQAQAIIEMAEQNARAVEAAAQEKISQWWEENEKKLEVESNEALQQGFEEGFVKGKQDAESTVQQEYQGRIEQAQHLLEQAYDQKKVIISEAEPFLLELSTVIAAQIVKQELESDPNKMVELIKQHILRFKEKEFITVCVHPDDFEFIQEQRAHIIAVVNGETEIKIIPDHSVTPKGSIIRTAYGSVDARIDTQIEEIKKAILEARREPEGEIKN